MHKLLLTLAVFLFNLSIFSPYTIADDYDRAFEALKQKDYERAIYFLSFYASNGDNVAQYNMGVLYRDGLGVEKNIKVAVSWFLLAAEQDNMLANYAIARILDKNLFKSDGQNNVIHYYKEAAFLGHAIAPIDLGNFYFLRNNSPKDYVRAFIWWSLSLDRNAPGALENITKLENLLSQEQVDEINSILRDCDTKTLRICLADF